MSWPLALAGLALGAAATPHCALMCGAPCAALTRGCGRSAAGFQIGRLLSYMAAGAVAASSVAALGAWSQAAPALRPLWTLLHLAFLALGLWWLVAGRQPAWLNRSGAVPVTLVGARRRKPWRATLAGLAWAAWPCAALQGALVLSALANSAPGGALVMTAFALGSLPGLVAAPWAWARWQAWRGTAVAPAGVAALGFRVSGLALAGVSGWALTHVLWERFAAWCVT
jgi:sulfite exporter TauE/SafE